MPSNSHYKIGSDIIIHRGKPTQTIVTNFAANEIVKNIEFQFEVEEVYIPAGYEHRADLISNLFFDTPFYDWLILLLNNISDPFEGLNIGDKILLPKI